MIKDYIKYITEKLLTNDYKDAYKKYVIVNYFDDLYIGTLSTTDGYSINIICFYEFDKFKIKLSKKNKNLRIYYYYDKLNVIYHSDNMKDCLEKISEMYDDEFIPTKTYKKYIIGNIQRWNDSRVGLFEVVEDKNSWEKYYRENVKVRLLLVYYWNNNKIIKSYDDSVTKLINYRVEDNNITYQTDDYDDAYRELETNLIKGDARKYNL
jgi:hypothetical protein